jgi:NAD(P)H-dependent FMN reductase
VVFSTPEYAGAIPGSFKNLLDWTVGGTELNGKPVSWLNPASGGAGNTYASLATILGYVDANVVTGACVRSPLGHLAVNEDGRIPDPAFRSLLATAAAALAAYLATKRSVEDPSP